MDDKTTTETSKKSRLPLNDKQKKIGKWAAVGILAAGVLLLINDKLSKKDDEPDSDVEA